MSDRTEPRGTKVDSHLILKSLAREFTLKHLRLLGTLIQCKSVECIIQHPNGSSYDGAEDTIIILLEVQTT
jgi:hypothetical protein